MSSELELLLTWSTGTSVTGGRLTHSRLGHSVDIPPTRIRADSSATDIELADLALTSGLASSRFDGRITPLSLLRAESQLPLKPVSVFTLPPSALKTAGVIGGAFARAHLVPLILLAGLTFGSMTIGATDLFHILLAIWFAAATVMIHEVGHGVALRILSRGTPAVFVMHRLSPRVIRREIRPRADILVTIAGPVAPLLLQLALIPLLLQAPLELIVASILSLSHLITLLVAGGDGQEFRLAMNRLRLGGGRAPNKY